MIIGTSFFLFYKPNPISIKISAEWDKKANWTDICFVAIGGKGKLGERGREMSGDIKLRAPVIIERGLYYPEGSDYIRWSYDNGYEKINGSVFISQLVDATAFQKEKYENYEIDSVNYDVFDFTNFTWCCKVDSYPEVCESITLPPKCSSDGKVL